MIMVYDNYDVMYNYVKKEQNIKIKMTKFMNTTDDCLYHFFLSKYIYITIRS